MHAEDFSALYSAESNKGICELETEKSWWYRQNVIVIFLAYIRDQNFYLTKIFLFLHSARMTAQPGYPFENISEIAPQSNITSIENYFLLKEKPYQL